MNVMSVQQMEVWQPVGFDPRNVLPAGLWRHADLIRFVVHLLLSGNFYRPKDSWVPLNRQRMIKSFGGNWKAWDAIRQGLIDANVIQCDARYSKGKQSMRYRLVPHWNNKPIERFNIGDAALSGRLLEIESRDAGRDRFEPVHYHLESCVKQVHVDEIQAWHAMATMTPEQRLYSERVISFIHAGDPRMKLGSTGRVYSSVTCLPRIIRPSLRINGESLVELDISNSQPLLLGIICSHARVQPLGVRGERERGNRSLLSLLSTQNAPILDGCTEIDVREWVNACTDGLLYEQVAEALGMPCNPGEERDKVKVATCRIMFGRYHPEYRSWRRFSERWPTIAAFVAEIKRHNHRNVARLLQRAEAALMIAGVCDGLRVDQPDTPVLTIHDSLMVPLLAEDIARLAIRAAWHEIGSVPRIRSVDLAQE